MLSSLPTPVSYVLCLLLFQGLFTVLGLGATLALIPARLQRCTLVFAPVVGLCLLSWFGWESMSFGLPGTNTTAPWFCLAACVVLLVPIVRGRVPWSTLFNAEFLIALAVAFCGTLVLSYPAMAEPNLTAISGGNHDIASYALNERFLMLHSVGDRPGYVGQCGQIVGLILEAVPGVYFASALSSSVLGLESYQLENVAFAAYAMWGALVLYVMAREVFRFSARGALVLLAAFSVNPLILYLAAQGFKAQLAAMVIASSLYCWVAPGFGRENSPTWREMAGAILFCWGLAATYPHMLPAVLLPLAFLSVVLAVAARSFRRLRWPLVTAVVALAGTAALSPERARGVYRSLVFLKGVVAGWFIPWISPAAFFGLSGMNDFSRYAHLPWQAEASLGLVLGVLVAAGLAGAWRRERDTFFAAFSFLLVIGGVYGYLILKDRDTSGLGGYKAFKWISFFAPVLWCSALLIVREAQPRPLARWAQQLLALALIAGNTVSGVRYDKFLRANHRSVSPALSELTSLDADPRVDSLNLVTSDFWDGMWETTFLFHKNLYPTHQTYYPASPALGKWTLDDLTRDSILKVEPCWASAVRVNDRFEAVRGSPNLAAEWQGGWQGDERTHRWTTETVASIRFHSRPHEPIRITLRYRPLDPSDQLSVRLNGSMVAACSDGERCSFDAAAGQGDNLLELAGSVPPRAPGNGDPRPLGMAFSEIRIAERGCSISSVGGPSRDGSGRNEER